MAVTALGRHQREAEACGCAVIEDIHSVVGELESDREGKDRSCEAVESVFVVAFC